MSEPIEIKGTVINKHMTEEEWDVVEYIPYDGELIIYDPDASHTHPRFKSGDGERIAKELPFMIDGSVSDWAREESVPSGVWVEDEPMPEDYYVAIVADNTPIVLQSEMYCHNITLGYRDARVTMDQNQKDENSTTYFRGAKMFNAVFQIYNDDPEPYSFDFASQSSNQTDYPNYGQSQNMLPGEAWKLLKLYRALQNTTNKNGSRETQGVMATGVLFHYGQLAPIAKIIATYTTQHDTEDEDEYRKILVTTWHLYEGAIGNRENSVRFMPTYNVIYCGKTEFDAEGNELPEKIEKTYEAFIDEETGSYNPADFPHYALVCTDYVTKITSNTINFAETPSSPTPNPPQEEEQE